MSDLSTTLRTKNTLAGTGHRPDKLGGYTDQVYQLLRTIATEALRIHRPDVVISGMAMGWDMALAATALDLRIPLVAAIPFHGQEAQWPSRVQLFYTHLLAKADALVVTSKGEYAAHKMQTRNRWMVENCSKVLALYDGSGGGTANCVKYAWKMKRPVVHLWPEWYKLVTPLIAPVEYYKRPPTRVVHWQCDPYDVPIMRPTKWGNPFEVARYGREESIEKYKLWFPNQPYLVCALPELHGQTLGCACKGPVNKPCHGDFLAEMADTAPWLS